MRNIIKITCTASLLLFLITQSAIAKKFDFRKTYWGMSVAQVEQAESSELALKENGALCYASKILRKDVFIVYRFAEGKLVGSSYVLRAKHTNKNDFINDFEEFKEILSKKYGSPTSDDTFWKNDLYKSKYEDWGFAISLGHLAYISQWEDNNTKICSMLYGENYEISCAIDYESKELIHIKERAEEQQELANF